MADAERLALAERLKEARLHTAALRKTEVPKEEMAVILGAVLGRKFHPTQWRRYESGESEPPLEVIRAVAKVSGLTEAYIAFGPAATVNRAAALEEPDNPAPRAGTTRAADDAKSA